MENFIRIQNQVKLIQSETLFLVFGHSPRQQAFVLSSPKRFYWEQSDKKDFCLICIGKHRVPPSLAHGRKPGAGGLHRKSALERAFVMGGLPSTWPALSLI